MKSFPKHAVASRKVQSSMGELILLASEKGLAGLFFGHRVGDHALPPNDGKNQFLNSAERQLVTYFSGRRENFELPFDIRGTDFQKSVWAELTRIPFGETRSYLDIAKSIGNPKGVRAVGLANGSNPISIIVPCHRVIGADGSLTGFGGGLELKQQLLIHEGALLELGV